MSPLVWAILGCLLTSITAYGVGRLLLSLGDVWLPTAERRVMALLVGLPALSLVMFGLAAGQVLSVASCTALSFAGVIAALWPFPSAKAPVPHDGGELPPAQQTAFIALTIGILCYVALYLRFASVPDVGFDSSYYHLGFVRRYLEHGGFLYYTDNLYAALSQGAELLFLHAYSVGAESAASLFHLSTLGLAAAIVYWLLVAETGSLVALAASLMLFATPVLGKTATFAYVDAVVLVAVLGTIWLLEQWRRHDRTAFLVYAGLLAGFAYAVKYTAFAILFLAVLYVAWQLRRQPQRALRAICILGGAASLLVLPWVIRNALVYDNPFAPFFNAHFPNPYFLVAQEEAYRAKLKTYDWLVSWNQLPRELFFGGANLQGIIGFGFLVTPLGLLGLRRPLGIWSLAGLVLFLAIYPSNVGVRFLIPVLGFASLLLALSLRGKPWVFVAVASIHAATAWPPVLHQLVDQGAWVLGHAPRWSEATREDLRRTFLQNHLPEFRMAQMLDEVAVGTGKVFSYSAIAEGYSRNRVCLEFTSAECTHAGDLLLAGILPGRYPVRIHELRFEAVQTPALRLILDTESDEHRWTVNELRLYDSSAEVPRGESWRIRASHGGWWIPQAFDNSLASSWSPWRRARQGQFIEIQLGDPRTIDRLTVRVSPDWDFGRYRLEARSQDGSWQPLTHERTSRTDDDSYTPRDAALALRNAGFEYLVAYREDFHFSWLMRNKDAMGLELLAYSDDGLILFINP